MVLETGSGPSNEDVMQEIEQSMDEYKLWKREGILAGEKKTLRDSKMFASLARLPHHFQECVAVAVVDPHVSD